MGRRLITGLIATPIILALLWQGGLWWMALSGLVALAGGYEFYNLLRQGGYPSVPLIGLIWLELLVLRSWPGLVWIPLSAVVSVGMIALLIYVLYQPEKPLLQWLTTSSVALYLGITLGQMAALRLAPQGLWWVILILLLTWANDTFAYLVGMAMGRHKIWPRLSPKKSWEGTLGGLVGAALTGAILTHYTPVPLSVGAGIILGLVAGGLAFFGDLSISMVKRQVGAKDSGVFFPGHGGMLDRLDSLLFVIPLVYHVALLTTGG